MSRTAFAAVAVAALVVLGCGRRNTGGPPAIRYGQQPCAECRMLISEARFSAAADTPGATLVFDAVECLARWLAGGGSARRVWVHDDDSTAWLDGRTAWFVRSSWLSTPMGAGLVALGTEEAAKALAGRVQGDVLRFDQLAEVVRQGAVAPSP